MIELRWISKINPDENWEKGDRIHTNTHLAPVLQYREGKQRKGHRHIDGHGDCLVTTTTWSQWQNIKHVYEGEE